MYRKVVFVMLDNNIFVVYTRERKECGLYAIAEKIHANNNLVGYVQGCKTFNVCKTWKEAEKIAAQWNQDFLENGSQWKWI